MRKFEILDNASQLSIAAADHWVAVCQQSVRNRSDCHIALAGGSTPKMLYELLATDRYASQIDWSGLHIYFGDERCVPHDHEQSNFRMAAEALLSHVPIPRDQIHAIPFAASASESASQYAETLAHVAPQQHDFPVLDMVWLGMGDDGHTASLFPDTEILQEQHRSCAGVFVEKLQSWRVSLTFPVINNAKNVFILISGGGKAARLAQVVEDTSAGFPIESVRPKGNLYWLVDKEAAARLDREKMANDWIIEE